MVCGALTSDWYSCIKNRVAPSTRWASTGTCQSTLHSPCVSVCAKTTNCASFARPRNIQLTAEAGPALRSFVRCVTLVSVASDSRQFTDLFTRVTEMAVLSCWRASSSGSCTSLNATRARTKLASTSPTQINPNWTSTCSMFKGATGQPVFKGATQSAAASPATNPVQALHPSQPSAVSATPATQNTGGCHQVPRLPRQTKVDDTKCHACHAKCRGVTGD